MTESWLNGWSRQQDTVLMGGWVRCAGCGADRGTTCVVPDPDWDGIELPDPDWPFPIDDCPLCFFRENWIPTGIAWPKGKPRPLP